MSLEKEGVMVMSGGERDIRLASRSIRLILLEMVKPSVRKPRRERRGSSIWLMGEMAISIPGDGVPRLMENVEDEERDRD